MYSYALNNPIKFIDPDGDAPLLATAAAGAGIGFLIGAGKQAWSAYRTEADFATWKTWQNIGAKGAGAAVFGFGIGLTGGMNLYYTAGVAGVASVAGGGLERSLDADESTEPGNATEVVGDFAGGIVGGGVGFGTRALLRAKINTPEYFGMLQRQISRVTRIAQNTVRPARQTARMEQVHTLQSKHDFMNTWWQRFMFQWPAATARSGAKAGTKAVVTVTISYVEDEHKF